MIDIHCQVSQRENDKRMTRSFMIGLEGKPFHVISG
jgi:hypothetical protein